MPAVPDSDLPGLLGLTALRRNRAILDLHTMKVYFAGPGDYDLMTAMPPGTDCFQAELAPSGHMVVPCCEYGPPGQDEEHSLTLLSRPPGLENGTAEPKRKRRNPIPPPPDSPAPEMPQPVVPQPPDTGM